MESVGRTTRWRSRWGRRITALVAVSAAALVVTGGTAYAGNWVHQDGFEVNPATVWTVEHYGNSSGGFDINAGTARSGTNDAWLSAQTQFASVGKLVHLTPAQLHTSSCGAEIYVQPLGTAKVNFEIINPSNWTYIALTSRTLTGGSYTSVVAGLWTPGPIDVYVRISLLGTGGFSAVRVDDMQVQCGY